MRQPALDLHAPAGYRDSKNLEWSSIMGNGPTSRLAGRRPIRPPQLGGIGAGDADMQRASGSANPGVDAAMGGMSPDAQRQELEQQQKAAQEIEDTRVFLIELIKSGRWKLPGEASTPAKQVESLEGADDRMLTYWMGEYEAWTAQQNAVQDEKDEEVVRRMFRLGPEHPEYKSVLDQERRAATEEGLVPMDFAQLMMKNYVEQTIPIRDGFSIVLRSITTRQGQWLERLGRERLSQHSHLEQQHTFALWQVAVSLQAYVSGGHRSDVGHDLESFQGENEFKAFVAALDARMDLLANKPEELSHDFITQYVWFCGRVRSLITGDTVKRLGNS